MNSNTALATTEAAPTPKPQLLPKPQSRRLGDFFHCPHGVPEHHSCPRCEEESRVLPSFWDRD